VRDLCGCFRSRGVCLQGRGEQRAKLVLGVSFLGGWETSKDA